MTKASFFYKNSQFYKDLLDDIGNGWLSINYININDCLCQIQLSIQLLRDTLLIEDKSKIKFSLEDIWNNHFEDPEIERDALKIFLSCLHTMADTCSNEIFPEHPNDTKITPLLPELNKQIQQKIGRLENQALAKIVRDIRNVEKKKIEVDYSINHLKERISQTSSFEEKDYIIKEFIQNLKRDQKFREMLPENLVEAEDLLLEVRIQKKLDLIHDPKKTPSDNSFKHTTIFSQNGFALFDYLMMNQLTDGRGKIADVAFFYRAMESDGYIHARIKPFKEWVTEKYGMQIEKIKSYHELSTTKRLQAYTTAKEVLKFK